MTVNIKYSMRYFSKEVMIWVEGENERDYYDLIRLSTSSERGSRHATITTSHAVQSVVSTAVTFSGRHLFSMILNPMGINISLASLDVIIRTLSMI